MALIHVLSCPSGSLKKPKEPKLGDTADELYGEDCVGPALRLQDVMNEA